MYDADRLSFSLDDYRRDDQLAGLLRLTDDDIFRWLHYHGGMVRHHASDVDLVCVDANPEPHIAAFIEFKSCNEQASFPQSVLFESLSELAPVFIIRSKSRLLDTEPEAQRFDIERYTGMDADGAGWIKSEAVTEEVPWGGYISAVGDLDPAFDSGIIAWEDSHRAGTRNRGGRPWAALEPENARAWARGVRQ
jgi:hypothetical protein